MSQRIMFSRMFIAAGAFAMLGACAANTPPQHMAVASNPPPVRPGPGAVWYHVNFDTGSFAVDGAGQKTIADVKASLEQNPAAVATIIGKTDTVGGKDYNMHLSHRRADAVRDALVYDGNISADRVETRWTGENRQRVETGNDISAAGNRVVDIAIH